METPEGGLEQQVLDFARAMRFLEQAPFEIEGLMRGSSNYTFLVRLRDEGMEGLAIYKPQRGETPLWDFPIGTLCLREVAAFQVSEALTWRLVPPTVLREGPHGRGMVQLFIDADPREHYFTLRERFAGRMQYLAAFDLVINNADRKAGHVLRDAADHIWGIDHGTSFHEDDKMRTVIWDFAGRRLPAAIVADLTALQGQLAGDLRARLAPLLSPPEIAAMERRLRRLLRAGRFPPISAESQVPWPLV